MDRLTTIAELLPDSRNANHGTPRGRSALALSLSKYGAGRSILLDKDNRIIAGNKTAQCAGEIGIDKVRIIETDGKEIIAVKRTDLSLDDKQTRALALADNRVGQLDLEWDAEELTRCVTEGVVDPTMFTQEEIDRIVGITIKEGECDPDDAPEPTAEVKCATGDLWTLGNHRLLCGDSADAHVLARVLKGDSPTCVFTDPPYGVSIGAKSMMLNSCGRSPGHEDIIGDDCIPEDLREKLLPVFQNVKNAVAEDCTVFVTAPQGGDLGMMMMMMMMMMRDAGLPPRHVLIWKKNRATFSMGRLDYDYAHEPILLTWGKKHKRPMLGTHRTSVWEIDRPQKSKEHPTMKPVALYVNAFLNNSDSGDVVFDLFGGSGTCVVAAEQTGRRARVIEIAPNYCDVILARWAKFTNKDPVREDGAKWGDVCLG